MIRKLLIALVILLVLAGIGVFFLISNLDKIIEVAVEKSSTYVLEVDTQVDSVDLSLSEQRLALHGMTFASPAGFDSPEVMSFDEISVEVDAASFSGDEPTIKAIIIDSPSITLERHDGKFNLQRLIESASRLSGEGAPEEEAPAEATKPIIVERIELRSPQVRVVMPGLSGGSIPLPLPDVIMTDIGKDTGGKATPAEIFQEVLAELMGSIADAGALIPELGDMMGDLTEQLGNVKDLIGDGLGEVGNQAGEAVEGLRDGAGEAVNNLGESAGEAADSIRDGIGGLLGRDSDNSDEE